MGRCTIICIWSRGSKEMGLMRQGEFLYHLVDRTKSFVALKDIQIEFNFRNIINV